MEDGSGLSSDPQDLATLIDEIETKITRLQGQVEEEVEKSEKYKVRH